MANGKMNINVDNRLSIGTIIQILALIFIVFGWYFTTQANTRSIEALSESIGNIKFQKVDQAYFNEKISQHKENDEKLEQAIRELTNAVTSLKIEMAKNN